SRFFSTGYTTAPERIAINSGRMKEIKFHATCALIEHSQHGLIVFDTGYAPRFFELTSSWPQIIYALATPVACEPEWSLAHQLQAKGIEAESIRHLIISHFHADHIAGLKDFPQATFYCSRSGWKQIDQLNAFQGTRRGLLKGFLPDDFVQRAQFFEDMPKRKRSDAFSEHVDLFDDGSIRIIDLPGHARGQIGAILNENSAAPQLLAADAYWLKASLEKNHLPAKIITVFIDSWQEYVDSFHKLQAYRTQHPAVQFLSCHSPDVFDEWVEKVY
ncbi:MAG: MBL fold metallo-hydrolase, partial [Bacteroidota bacterium]